LPALGGASIPPAARATLGASDGYCSGQRLLCHPHHRVEGAVAEHAAQEQDRARAAAGGAARRVRGRRALRARAITSGLEAIAERSLPAPWAATATSSSAPPTWNARH